MGGVSGGVGGGGPVWPEDNKAHGTRTASTITAAAGPLCSDRARLSRLLQF